MFKKLTKFKTIASLFLLILLARGIAWGNDTEVTPGELLKSSDSARGNVGGIEWIIQLHSFENGREQNRTLKIKAHGRNSLAEFLKPARVKGRKLLMLDRNMWFIKPGLRKPVPISSRQKLSGGAANGDIASTNYAGDYNPESMSAVLLNGTECYLLDLVSRNKKVSYDRIRYWISKEQRLGIQAEFYTVSGKLIKTAVFSYENSLVINAKSRPFVSEMIITDALIADNITVMTYENVTVKDIPDSVFNLNLLRR